MDADIQAFFDTILHEPLLELIDDCVLGFQYKSEAERYLTAMQERLAAFGLTLNPEKTRLIEFGRYAAKRRQERGEGKQ